MPANWSRRFQRRWDAEDDGHMRHRAHTALYAFRMVATLGCLAAHGSASAQTTQELKRMSLEEVLSVPVTTLSRGPEAA